MESTVVSLGGGVYASAVYSEHDSGWYCEIFDAQGATLGSTGVHQTEEGALADAADVAEEYASH